MVNKNVKGVKSLINHSSVLLGKLPFRCFSCLQSQTGLFQANTFHKRTSQWNCSGPFRKERERWSLRFKPTGMQDDTFLVAGIPHSLRPPSLSCFQHRAQWCSCCESKQAHFAIVSTRGNNIHTHASTHISTERLIPM